MWRASDTEAYQIAFPGRSSRSLHRIISTARLLSVGQASGLYVSPATPCSGLVVHPRDSVIVIVMKSEEAVAKVSRPEANQKDVMDNERLAYRLLPEYVPAVIDTGGASEPGRFDYVVSEFAPNTHPISSEEWATVFHQVLEALITCYDRAGYHSVPAADLLDDADKAIKAAGDGTEFGALARDVTESILEVAYEYRDEQIATTFVHGDMTRDNVYRSERGTKIIDWGSSGYKLALYDLMIQEFYTASPRFWMGVRTAPRVEWFDNHFFGGLPPFLEGMRQRAGVQFSLSDIKANMVLSLLQKTTESVHRYRVVNEAEGVEFFTHIDKIRKALCKAA